MTKRVSAAEAKAHLSALMAEVAHKGEQIIIERWGKPVAALVSIEDLKSIKPKPAKSEKRGGALALAGLGKELGDDTIDEMVKDIYETRKNDTGRSVDLEI